jgi:hypothetical protein
MIGRANGCARSCVRHLPKSRPGSDRAQDNRINRRQGPPSAEQAGGADGPNTVQNLKKFTPDMGFALFAPRARAYALPDPAFPNLLPLALNARANA